MTKGFENFPESHLDVLLFDQIAFALLLWFKFFWFSDIRLHQSVLPEARSYPNAPNVSDSREDDLKGKAQYC
jgi:hypothetical protein